MKAAAQPARMAPVISQGVRRDHAHVARLDAEALCSHVIRLGSGLQTFGHIRRERLLEELAHLSVRQLRLGHLGGRVGQRGHAEACIA